jgi:hypothetical protein
MSSSYFPTFINKAKVQAADLLDQIRNFMITTYGQAGAVFDLSSAYGQILYAMSEISNMILYYIEDSITELNMYSASRTASIQGLARLAGHSITRSIAATGEVQITLLKNPVGVNGTQVVIPNYSSIKCTNNNLTYVLNLSQDELRINYGSTTPVYATVIQGEIHKQVYTSDGSYLQSYNIQERSFNFIDNFFVNVYVNGVLWTKYDSLYDMPNQATGYVSKTGISGGLDIYFGNGPFGQVPALGAIITVEYLKTSGSNGNIPSGDQVYFTWVDSGYSAYGETIDLNAITLTQMSQQITFGADGEDINLTKLIAPKTSRSYVLANTDSYIIFLQKFNYFSVVDAYTLTNNGEYINDNNVVYLFLIPKISNRLTSGQNYFTVPETMFTLSTAETNAIYNLIQNTGSQIVSTVVSIVNPTLLYYIMNVSLVTFDGYDKNTISSSIVNAVSNYFLTNTRRDRIPKSDLIAVIENIEGVDSVNISFISKANEDAIINGTQGGKLIGLDSFGDIVLNKEDLPLIRGGWTDSNGIYYVDGISNTNPCSLNINFVSTTPRVIQPGTVLY